MSEILIIKLSYNLSSIIVDLFDFPGIKNGENFMSRCSYYHFEDLGGNMHFIKESEFIPPFEWPVVKRNKGVNFRENISAGKRI